MQASVLTHNQARLVGSSDIRLAVAMCLDLSTLSTLDKFEFASYNENLSEATGLALKTVQNAMTQAKKLATQHHAKFAELVANYALSDAALTRGVQHVYGLLQAGGYGKSLPELAACLAGKASPMLKARADRAEAAAITNKALAEAANKPAPEVVAEAVAEVVAEAEAEAVAEASPVPQLGTLAEAEAEAEAPAEAPAEAEAEAPAEAEAEAEAPAEAEAEAEVVEVTEVNGPGFTCIIQDSATYDDLMSLAETIMDLAAQRQVQTTELMAA